MNRAVERLASTVLVWLVVSLWLVNPSWGAAQAGDLDPTFDLGPFVVRSVYAFAVQPDGKVLTGASSLTPTNRITRDENLTASVTGGTGVRAVVLQPDGKVLIGGDFTGVNGAGRGCVARLNSDGSLDQNFADSAVAKAETPIVLSLALQPDAKIVVGGDFTVVNGMPRNRVARLDANSNLDPSFHGRKVQKTTRAVERRQGSSRECGKLHCERGRRQPGRPLSGADTSAAPPETRGRSEAQEHDLLRHCRPNSDRLQPWDLVQTATFRMRARSVPTVTKDGRQAFGVEREDPGLDSQPRPTRCQDRARSTDGRRCPGDRRSPATRPQGGRP